MTQTRSDGVNQVPVEITVLANEQVIAVSPYLPLRAVWIFYSCEGRRGRHVELAELDKRPHDYADLIQIGPPVVVSCRRRAGLKGAVLRDVIPLVRKLLGRKEGCLASPAKFPPINWRLFISPEMDGETKVSKLCYRSDVVLRVVIIAHQNVAHVDVEMDKRWPMAVGRQFWKSQAAF